MTSLNQAAVKRVLLPLISHLNIRIVRGRMPTLELINERFARHMRIQLI